MRRAVTALVTVLAVTLFVAFVDAAPRSIEGAWTLTVEKMPLRMMVTLNGGNVGGTLDYPHGAPFQLKGRFADGALTFSGDSGGDNFTIHIDASGSLTPGDTLEGTINAHIVDLDPAGQPRRTHDQEWKWTAERSK